MALRPLVGFVGPSYTEQSKIAAYDRTVNWYPSRVESGTGAATYILYPAPGYLAGSDVVPTSPGRAIFALNGVIHVLYGDSLYTVSDTTTLRASGFSDASGGFAQILNNGDGGGQLLIRADTTLYSVDVATYTKTTITDPATSNMIGYLNSVGLSLNSLLSQVNFSAPFDFTSWDPLDVFQRSDAADRWLALLVNVKEIWLFGSQTTSVYYNDADDPDEPFKPNPNVLIQIGIIAPNSVCMVDGQPMWIGQGKDGAGVVYRANGYTPVRVSTYAVEYAFSQLPVDGVTPILTRAEGTTYQENGHVFYELTFPTTDDGTLKGSTWVYDATEGLWHERGAWDEIQFVELATRGHATDNSAQYTMSRTSGNFYTQSLALSTGTDGLGVKRLRRAPHINVAQQRIRYAHFRLLMETGLGLGNVPSTAVGFDPEITLSWSDDGGQTFGASYPVSAGQIGQFSTLVEWRQLGQARDRIFELTCSAPVPWRLVNAFLDYTVGPS